MEREKTTTFAKYFFIKNSGMTTNRVQILDKTFELSLSEEEIAVAVKRVAAQINEELKDENPLFIGVLNGAFMFMADLMKQVSIPSKVTFVKLASYEGMASTGKIKEIMGLSEDIKDRTVVIVEDIVDTGFTMQRMLEMLGTRNPKKICIASLFIKPEKLQVPLTVDYVAFSIPNDFIVGYGLDYDGYGRNLSAVYTLAE